MNSITVSGNSSSVSVTTFEPEGGRVTGISCNASFPSTGGTHSIFINVSMNGQTVTGGGNSVTGYFGGVSYNSGFIDVPMGCGTIVVQVIYSGPVTPTVLSGAVGYDEGDDMFGALL